jgi:hypothetical protein
VATNPLALASQSRSQSLPQLAPMFRFLSQLYAFDFLPLAKGEDLCDRHEPRSRGRHRFRGTLTPWPTPWPPRGSSFRGAFPVLPTRVH